MLVVVFMDEKEKVVPTWQWQTVRVLAVVELGGSRYEAADNHPFSNSPQPSPVSVPMLDLVKSLFNQTLLF